MSKEYNGLDPQNESFKEKIINWWNKLVDHCKNDYKKILIAYAIFLGVAIAAILIDQLTKTFLFEWNSAHTGGSNDTTYQGTLIGVRSVGHYGVTFIPSAEHKRGPLIFIQFLSIIILIGLLTIPLLSKHLSTIIICAIIWAGDFGNMLDRFLFNMMVKDIFFVPFVEKWSGRTLGTFNFADVCIVVGCISLVIFIFTEIFIEKIRTNKEKENIEIIDKIVQEDNKNNNVEENINNEIKDDKDE
ncbi:signal peptidase II [Mycoplasmopsis caviae]|uniref:Lipoprotein signal peptidase n=1 Tax=Mycoplasmopsis caviae TaxID=55603 RepID=A0A3P8MEG4_9BACT|nr:signal peptidase II [Mycoplasmopsis caviae]UUD35542.1 signal peptidase II [Mycoplasmopsis caviae]VDR41686.1 lipoprotein signal peptidase [Mycoplasmopsis caviae]